MGLLSLFTPPRARKVMGIAMWRARQSGNTETASESPDSGYLEPGMAFVNDTDPDPRDDSKIQWDFTPEELEAFELAMQEGIEAIREESEEEQKRLAGAARTELGSTDQSPVDDGETDP